MDNIIKRIDVIDESGMGLLKKLKNQTLSNIVVDYCFSALEASEPDYDWIEHIFFETDENSKLFYLQNKHIDEAVDKDQYCSFKFSECGKDQLNMKHQFMKLDSDKQPVVDRIIDYKWQKVNFGSKIDSIHIYRDNATWTYGSRNWDITTDVAIKLAGNKFKCLFVLQDTLFSFVSVHLNYTEDENEFINEHWKATKWGFKSENLTLLDRQCIEL